MNRGVVSAGDSQTVDAGLTILRAGGNAMDAIVAAACASFVVEAPLATPAGGGVLLAGGPDGHVLHDFFATVPGLGLGPVDRGALDFYEVVVDYGPTSQGFHIGRGSAAVPTAMLGLLRAHAEGGRLPLSEVVAPAIALADAGYTLSPHVQVVFGLLSPILLGTPSVAAIHGIDGALPPPSAHMRNQPLADFFRAVAAGGEGFLRNDFARDVVADFGPDVGGRITLEDMASYQPRRRTPLEVDLGRHGTLLTNGPPASGGLLIGLSLQIALHLGLGEEPFLGADHLSKVAKVLGAVSAARTSGFDDVVHDPEAALRFLTPESIAKWADHAAADREERHLGHTTHLSVIDADGAYASLTMSNGEGAGIALPKWGVHMNNFLGEEDINPTGFHNAPAGSRLTTMMSPTVVWRDGRPAVVIGSGGSNRIRTAIFQVLLNHLAYGRPLHEAANVARIHVEGTQLWFESVGVHADAVARLCREWPGAAEFAERSMFFGGVHAAGWADGPYGGADSRRGGIAAT